MEAYNFLTKLQAHNDTNNDSDVGVNVSHISGFSSFNFTDFEASGFGSASNKPELKLNIPNSNDGKSDDESKLFSQFLKKSSTPVSPEHSLNESTLSLAKIEALDDELHANFLLSQTEEVERNVTLFLTNTPFKLEEEIHGTQNSLIEDNVNNESPSGERIDMLLNESEKDSFILKDVKTRFGLASVNETTLCYMPPEMKKSDEESKRSMLSDDIPIQKRLAQRQSDLNRDAERLAGQIMIERPNLDGSSSDSEDNVTVGNTGTANILVRSGAPYIPRHGIIKSMPNNPRMNLQDQFDDLNLDSVPERQSAEGGRNNDLPFVDGGGGGDGSSGHSDDDLGGDGGVFIRNQRLVPATGSDHTNSDDERITPPSRERPVGGSENNCENLNISTKQVKFSQLNPVSLNSSSPNHSSDDRLLLTLVEQNVNLDLTPCEEQESRLSSRYFLAASTPFLAASTVSDQSPDYESRTMRLEDFHDEESILKNDNETLTNNSTCGLRLPYGDISEWAKGNSQGEEPGDSFFGGGFNGNTEDEFQVINQDFEGLLEADEKVVAENNDTVIMDADETDISEWSVRTDNVCINPELLPSVNSTNSDGNVSRYFKCKSHDLGKSLGKKGSRPKFSDATFSITSPEKGSPVKLIEETLAIDPPTQFMHNEETYVKNDGAIRTSEPQVLKQNIDGEKTSKSYRKLSDTMSKKSRSRSSITTRHCNEKSKTGKGSKSSEPEGRTSDTCAGQDSFVGETFSIPICKQDAGTLLNNIQERRVSIVGMGKTQIEYLAKTISSLTGSDVRVVYKVLQIMSKENLANISNHKSEENFFKKDSIVHPTKEIESSVHTTVSGSTATNMHPQHIGTIPDNMPPHSFMDSISSSENLYHTLYPTVDRDSFSRVPSSLQNNTNNYKLAAVTPYQVVSSHVSPMNSRREYLRSSGESRNDMIYASNDSMSSFSAGSVYTVPHVNLNDAISYAPNIDFGFCCIGEKTTKIFKMYNSNSCWIQLHFNIVFFAYNGCENKEHHTEPFMINPTKIVLGPNSAEEVKVKFLPKQTGSFMMKVELLAAPLVDGGDKSVNWPRLPKLLSIEGICELPDLEVILGENKCINFGEVPYGTCCSRQLNILNKGRADIPVKLLISSSLSAMGFSFENSSTVSSTSGHPPVASTVVKGHGEGGAPIRPAVVIIKYHAPHRPPDHTQHAQTIPEEHSCQLDIKTDTENILPISRLLMKAAVGFLRLHSLRTLQPICLSCIEGTQCKETIPLRNAGNLTLNLAIKLCGTSPFFTLSPSYLKLQPGEESEVKVLFSPNVPAYVESILKVSILPDGDEYEWTLKGKSSKSIPTVSKGTKPTLLCNTHALNWSGVPIGQSQQQKLILHNSSDNQSMHLSLSIAGDHANFQVVNDVKFTQKDMNKFETVINPKEELPVHVLFLPTYLHMAHSSLVLRTLDGFNKFLIPLCGYGGKSQLDISGANNLHNQFWIDMDEVYLGKKNIMNLMLRNSGSRAAFISIKCFADITARLEYPATHVCIMPNNFVLKEKVSTQITLSYQPLQDHAKKLQEGTYTSAHLVIYSGDEVLRKAYRKQICGAHGNPVLKTLDSCFTNEENVSEEISYTRVSDWNNFLHASIDKTVIALVARYQTETPQSSSQDRLQEMMIHVTPAQKLKTSTDAETQLSGIWSVSPEKIVLNTSEEGSACKLKMVNNSNKSISFEFIWPGQTLIITPCKDKIPPRSQLIIRVSVKTSFLAGAEDLPWRGNIYIQCNGEQKGVEVEICNDAVSEQSPMLPANDMVAISPNDVSIIPHLNTGKEKAVEKHITVSPPILEFAETKLGCASDSFVTITNRFDVTCVWNLISIAPPYCKSLDGKSGIARVTYTAFRFSKQSGSLGGKENMKLSVSFHPRAEGMYSQFWEIEVTSEISLTPNKTRLEVNGQGHLSIVDCSVENRKNISDTSTKTLPAGKKSVDNEEVKCHSVDKNQLVFVKDSLVTFPQTNVGDKRSMYFRICNRSEKVQKVKLAGFKLPFEIDHMTLTLRAKNYVRVPIYFSPQVANTISQGSVDVILEDGSIIVVKVVGKSS